MRFTKYFLLPFLIFTTYNLFSQDIEQNIKEIRNQFKWINQQKNFSTVILENQEFTDDIPSEGCGLKVFYKDKNIYKVIEENITSFASINTEYYLKNNQLIFVYKYEEQYNYTDENNIINTKKSYEERVYYKDNKIIRRLEKGKSLINKSADYQKILNSYLKSINTKIKYPQIYKSLQGTWVDSEDPDIEYNNFDIAGLIVYIYNPKTLEPTMFRLNYDGNHLWLHNTENPQTNDYKFKILELTKTKIELQNKLSSEVLIYHRTE